MSKRVLLEQKGYSYQLFQIGDDYELIVPSPEPAPGVDVIHRLTKVEISAYKSSGISALSTRIHQMKQNPTTYKTRSWR